jgi:hypothetical protein
MKTLNKKAMALSALLIASSFAPVATAAVSDWFKPASYKAAFKSVFSLTTQNDDGESIPAGITAKLKAFATEPKCVVPTAVAAAAVAGLSFLAYKKFIKKARPNNGGGQE